jgi:hypothetical protein
MKKPTILNTERVDDIPLLLAQLERMGVQELLEQHLSHMSIRRLLKQQKYSLKANRKSVATTQHPQRTPILRFPLI